MVGGGTNQGDTNHEVLNPRSVFAAKMGVFTDLYKTKIDLYQSTIKIKPVV